MANHLKPLRVAIVVQLLLSGAGQREAAARAGVHRSAVVRIEGQLAEWLHSDRAIDPALRALARAVRLRTESGRSVLHEEVLLGLIKRAAVEAVEMRRT